MTTDKSVEEEQMKVYWEEWAIEPGPTTEEEQGYEGLEEIMRYTVPEVGFLYHSN
jgi:hypothetical protein